MVRGDPDQPRGRLPARPRAHKLPDRLGLVLEMAALLHDIGEVVHRRAHQCWRYVEEEAAPSEGHDGSGIAELPPRLYGTLASLALV